MKVKIEKIIDEASNIRSYKLVPEQNGETLPSFTAGSHVDVFIKEDLTRQYSICSDPAENAYYRLGIQKDELSTGGSRAIFNHFQEEQIIEISEPRNHFKLDVNGEEFVLIGGGIGITPILAMAQWLATNGKKFKLFYLARSKDLFGFSDLLNQSNLKDHVHYHSDSDKGLPDLGNMIGEWKDGSQVYCCGPAPLMDAVANTCKKWPSKSVHFEHFTRGEVDDSGNEEFEVQLGKDGPVITVTADKSVLDVLEANGIEVETQCTQGLCGTCEHAVLVGEVDHRDLVLDDDEKAENSCMMVCVSRAKSKRIVLDV
jgi:vanillate O-demethylase ferredoxin subunit